MRDKELIFALRCTATGTSKCREKGCRFYLEEYVPEHLREMTGGKEYLPSCDVDGIAIEAAARLEELLEAADGQD